MKKVIIASLTALLLTGCGTVEKAATDSDSQSESSIETTSEADSASESSAIESSAEASDSVSENDTDTSDTKPVIDENTDRKELTETNSASESSANESSAEASDSVSDDNTDTSDTKSVIDKNTNRKELTEDEKLYVSESDVISFIEAVKSKDVSKVAMYANTTEDTVNTWISNVEIGDYVIVGSYNAGETICDPYTLVKMDIIAGDGNVFKETDDLYRFYSSNASGPIGAIRSDYKSVYTNEPLTSLCHKYQVLIGADFDNAQELMSIPNVSLSLREFAYINHDSINSMDDLTAAVKDNIAIDEIEWDHTALEYNGGLFEEYELPPKGNVWYFYDIISDEGTSAVINYYADMFGFVKAKTVEYTYSRNDNRTPRLTAVHTIYDSGFDISFGTV